ncbi:MAG: ribonucleoside-diphosphate reductase subunit alpha [Rhodospirillales bacterium]|nr:ribonucleoside-diphosphate reductase subunit alpha [Rhodospirillales bacterium]MCB9979561.1 ribonucleoside-diphosphate reductase subunit alpha [Rhodospirillales bacterium]
MVEVIQKKQGNRVEINRSRDENLTGFGKSTLYDRYLLPDEDPQDRFANVAAAYGDDSHHAQRVYDYISKLWFMPATPVLSNGGTTRGLPISCFLNESGDSLDDIMTLWNENVWLASNGGGIGSYWGNVRSIGEKVGINGKTSGIVPFIKVMDSLTLAISQGSLRRGSAAIYLDIHHPEIEEFIDIRKPQGGDPNRKALNLHHGVLVSNKFMHAVENGEEWALKSPKDGHIVAKVSARDLWIRLLTSRIETGEPYIVYIDHVNDRIPDHHKMAGLNVKMSNLCSEITLPTGRDHLGNDRTAVCCLSSLNLEKFDEWKDHPTFIEDVMRFLDNVLSDFIKRAPDSMKRAKYAAMRERSVGLGVMGFHSYLQSKMIPMESVMAKVWNKRMFQHIRQQADAASRTLALEKGPCPDAADYGIQERFSNKMAIAPTASISIICGGASPGIEPIAANAYTHKTLSGSFPVKNKYLADVLEEKGQNTDDVWSSIFTNEGSVQHLDFLTQDEKDVFKTAFEMDQRWLVEHAADRAPFICQAQSLNVFLPGNVHKKELHAIHWMAWKKGVKSLYYCRSKSIQRAESNASWLRSKEGEDDQQGGASAGTPIAPNRQPSLTDQPEYEECLACQ